MKNYFKNNLKQRASKNKKTIKLVVFCFVAIVVAGAPAIFVNSIFGYLPIITILVAMGVSYVYLRMLKKRLMYEELSDLANCRRETSIDFTVKLQNKSLLIYPKLEAFFYVSDLFSKDDAITETVLTLAPKEERKFEFAIRFDHIGSYSAGLKRLKIYDLLGLFNNTIENHKEYRVNVAPKIFDVEHIKISDTALNESEKMTSPVVVDGADYAGVREYVWGDPIKTIHWKLSARTENYMTKIFENYGIVGISIIFDFFSPKYDNETLMTVFDSIVETGLSVGVYAEERGMDCEIVYSNRYDEIKKFSSLHYEEYVELIADMPKISTTLNEHKGLDILVDEGNSRHSHGNIAYCSANITDKLVNILIELKNLRKNPILFAIIPDNIEEKGREELMKPLKILSLNDITYYVLSSAKELGSGEKL